MPDVHGRTTGRRTGNPESLPVPRPMVQGRLGATLAMTAVLCVLAPLPSWTAPWPPLPRAVRSLGVLSAQPSIRSATPAAISLPPGGPAEEMVLRGARLDGVEGVEVTSGGTPVASVSARILRRSPGELVLSLLAGAEARPGSPLVAVLLAGRSRVEVPATLDVGATTPMEPEPPPTPSDSPTGESPEPVFLGVGTLRASVIPAGTAATPPDPVTRAAGTFQATVAPSSAPPPSPVSREVGTFRATIAPPGGGG